MKSEMRNQRRRSRERFVPFDEWPFVPFDSIDPILLDSKAAFQSAHHRRVRTSEDDWWRLATREGAARSRKRLSGERAL